MSETSEYGYSSATESLSTIEAENEYPLPTFGYPEYNHGWVECNSKSFPGRTYYFNVDSCCSTWTRPVSRFVPTPLVRPLRLQSDEDFLDVAPIIVSDSEDEEEDYNNNCQIKTENGEECEDIKPTLKLSKKEEREREIFDDVMFKLYRCSSHEFNNEEPEETLQIKQEKLSCEFEECDENSEIFMPETCYSSDSESESTESLEKICANDSILSESFGSACDFSLWERKDSEFLSPPLVVSGGSTASTFLMKNWLSPKKENSPSESFSYKNPSFERLNDNCELSNALNSLNVDNSENFTVAKREYESPNSTVNYESSVDSDSTSDDEDIVKIDYFTFPKLKRIEFSDLLTEPKNRSGKRRKRKVSKKTVEKKEPPKKFIKTICVLNGITTVNYDYLTPQLPDGVVMSNLSDSGSSTCYDVWNALNVKKEIKKESLDETKESPKRYQFLTHDLLDITDPCLSDSSSDSSCATVIINKTAETAKILKSQNVSESDSDSSDSSSSSCRSKSSKSSKEEKAIPETSKKPNGTVKNNLPSSFLLNNSLNSDKSWVASGSSDDEDL